MSKVKVPEAALATCHGSLKWRTAPFGMVQCMRMPEHNGRHLSSWLDADGGWHSLEWTDLEAFCAAISE